MARVLVVDDSEDLQDALRTVLADAGFEVASALDGATGLRLTRELHPDVILLDMMMPEVDGLEFLERLARQPSPPPVVAQSGFPDFRAEAMRRGAHAFLVKPLSLDVLLAALQSALERHPVGPLLSSRNAAEVEGARRAALQETTRAVSRLDERGIVAAREGLRRITRWLSKYFGFGTSLVTILREAQCCIDAIHGAAESAFPEGGRYPREDFYCDDVIAAGSTLLLTDAEHHPVEHFARHKALEYGVRFYAGVPLTAPSGAVFGTLCIVDERPREFRTEDMRVLEALGLGAARGLESHVWPLYDDGVFRKEYLELFVDVAAVRAAREGGACVELTVEARTQRVAVREGTGVAVVRLDAGRLAFLWSGRADGWTPPPEVAAQTLGRVELRSARDPDAARSQLRALCAGG